ncbi:MAG: ATP-binding protein [Proteobacteria bacterium]|nr:ATP-binding protein [Pseudomonadota bacterium]
MGLRLPIDEILTSGIKSRSTPDKILCDLLEAELAERQVRSIRYRMGLAKFPADISYSTLSRSSTSEHR